MLQKSFANKIANTNLAKKNVLFGTNFHNSAISGATDLRFCMEVHIDDDDDDDDDVDCDNNFFFFFN